MQVGPQTVDDVHISLYKILMVHDNDIMQWLLWITFIEIIADGDTIVVQRKKFEAQLPTETLFYSEKDHDLDVRIFCAE
jgi:hypothetical protein